MMARTTKQLRSRDALRRVATVAGWIIAPLPMTSAISINIESAAGKSFGWLAAALTGVILAALFIEAARHSRAWAGRIGWLALGLIFTAANFANALSNATHTSDGRSDHRKQQIQADSDRSSQRERLSQRRKAQVQLAGEDSPDAIE